MYVGNDPMNRTDPTGECDVVCRRAISVAATRAGGRYVTSAIVSQVDSPLPGPADAVAVVGAVVTTGALIWDIGSAVLNNDADAPPLPEGLVGVQDGRGGRDRDKEHNSGPLAPESGGTGSAEGDFEVLGGPNGQPAAEGSRGAPGRIIAPNGVQIRPNGRNGPRIDIPANGDKPREVLHYPPRENR
ncbi:hypothetical protein D3C85_1106320 [compost metagenome]